MLLFFLFFLCLLQSPEYLSFFQCFMFFPLSEDYDMTLQVHSCCLCYLVSSELARKEQAELTSDPEEESLMNTEVTSTHTSPERHSQELQSEPFNELMNNTNTNSNNSFQEDSELDHSPHRPQSPSEDKETTSHGPISPEQLPWNGRNAS